MFIRLTAAKSLFVPYFLDKLGTAAAEITSPTIQCAGSGTTLLAAANMGRKAYGFEIKKDFCAEAQVNYGPKSKPTWTQSGRY